MKDVFAQLAGTREALAAAETRAEEWKAAFGIKHGLDDPEVAAEYVKALIENEGEAQARAERYREALERIAEPARELVVDGEFERVRKGAQLPYEIARAALTDAAEQPLKAEQTGCTPTDQQTDTQRQHGDRDGEVDGATPDSFDHDGSLNDSGRADSQREAEDVEAWRERRQVFEGPDS